jgi:FKBP-type peptidyl-prolyl cis-trans isomerase FkpA
MNLKNLVLLTIVFAILFSCSKSSSTVTTCSWDSCAYKAPPAEIQAVHDSLYNRFDSRQQCSGLFYHIIDTGTGNRPTPCSSVNVTYVGKFTDSLGKKFDSSTVTIPLNQVIPGWRDGIPLIKEGGRILLYIPPSLGYGPNPYLSIPGNSILYFDVKLNSVL